VILYVLRHGIAAEASDWNGPDADRPLTSEGIKKMKQAALAMRKLDITFNHLFTSPWKRAQDTAAIVAKAYHAEDSLIISKPLAGNGDPEKVIQRLAETVKSWETAMIVGHEPYLSRLISVLVTGKTSMSLDLKKGGLVKLSADALSYGHCATLEWCLPPKVLKKL